ncbi:MAG: TauD/TfdA family dioxygenase [Luminiphilus sp.]|nr:TauD/TfdA family dioxygenase [Luminiphilus sp.]
MSTLPTSTQAPDFYEYAPTPLSAAVPDGDCINASWPDGLGLSCHRFWLRENAVGQGGIDPATREGILDPAHLNDNMAVASSSVSPEGDLEIVWSDSGERSVYHSGWLRHVAEQRHRPDSWLPPALPWTTDTLPEVPRVLGVNLLNDDMRLQALLNSLLEKGVCVLEQVPAEVGYLLDLAERIGPVRDSNFGRLWDVRADVEVAGDAKTNSTANTGLRLGPHSDLPTREIPPGFQFLHCIINEAEGGESTLTDGAALVEALRADHPEEFDLLCTRHWIFFNRGPGIDHRWSAPIIDYLPGSTIPTIRAFYQVRAYPNMTEADIAEAYDALRLFHRLADEPQFELKFKLNPGEVMCFDNRRILHGREAFSGSGLRHLQGIYIDRDEITSRARALNRSMRSS